MIAVMVSALEVVLVGVAEEVTGRAETNGEERRMETERGIRDE